MVVIAVRHGPEANRAFPKKAFVQQLRTRQRRRVGRVAHLIDAELPLYEGDDPPVVEIGKD
jgi:hypothetical protein